MGRRKMCGYDSFMLAAGTAEKNRFLSGISPSTRSLFESRMSVHGGGIGDVLQRPDTPIDAVWFPLAGFVSTLRPLEGESLVEVDAARAPRKTRKPAAREPESFKRSTSPLRMRASNSSPS